MIGEKEQKIHVLAKSNNKFKDWGNKIKQRGRKIQIVVKQKPKSG